MRRAAWILALLAALAASCERVVDLTPDPDASRDDTIVVPDAQDGGAVEDAGSDAGLPDAIEPDAL